LITVTRSLARQVRAVFRKALGITLRGLTCPVTLETGPEGLRIRAISPDAAAEYREPGNLAPERLVVPFELMADCEGRKSEPVQIEPQGDRAIVAQWRDGKVPQLIRYDVPSNPTKLAFPGEPDSLTENPPAILAALHGAAQTTDRESVRFAIGCIQLRGRDGSIRATDGRQLLVHSGFALPWSDDRLIPGIDVFGCKDLPQDQAVQIGCTGDWVTFVIGPWTIHLRINKDGRFPDIDRHIPRDSAVTSRLRISPADAEFLADTLSKLPSDDEHNQPVTLDLNGSVAIRARGPGQAQPTEVVLSGSSYSGEPTRIHSNRKYLARALRLGFRELHVVSPKVPALCRDDRRSYAWALLDSKSAIGPSPDVVRVVSPTVEKPTIPINRIQRSKIAMTEPIVNQDSPPKVNGQAATNGHVRKLVRRKADQRDTAALIDQAEKVRTAMRSLLGQANELVKTLKQHRRQSRIVASTLRQLKAIQV